MKKIIFFALLLCLVLFWFTYSNPAKSYFTKQDFQSSPLVTPFSQLWENDSLQNRPVWVKAYVNSSISTKFAGYCVLKNENSDLLVLAQGMTPMQGKIIYALIIPREFIMIQNQEYLLGALVHYMYQPIPEANKRLDAARNQSRFFVKSEIDN